ncbi:hypothetical protein VTJ04DRAFT_2368 [Mycothermus thermophilus]|uniref:uncharacterized protein n=1 Tax=Humicola insolens TaxID=85995 RepID=UPI0037443326
MLRYLSPSKIALLSLIQIYLEGAISNDGIVPIIDFITSHILDSGVGSSFATPADQWSRAESAIRLAASIGRFEEVLTPFPAVDRLPGRNLWDRLLEKLWAIDSLHALHDFFDELPGRCLAKTKKELREMAERGEPPPPPRVLLTVNSPFGTFVRKAHLEFAKLHFDRVAELWKAFVRYRQPTAAYWRRRNPNHSRLSFDAVLEGGQEEWGAHTDNVAVAAYGRMLLVDDQDPAPPVSLDDVESLLEFQIEQVQRYGTRVPQNVRKQFQELIKNCRVTPNLTHYLNFTDSWRSGEFPTSFDDLHRYFDYTMQSRDRLFYQYALLNLGIVQSDFGCHKEAVATMLEAIATAKENRDTACLNFALNWFFQLSLAHPHLVKSLEDNSMLGSGRELLAFLRTKAKETGMWILWSSSLLSEAKLTLLKGDSISTAIDNMVRCYHVIAEKNVKSMIGSHHALSIELWDRLGISALSTIANEIFLRCHARTAVYDDHLRLTCRLAGALASRGRYQDAFFRLESIDPDMLRSARAEQYWRLCRALIKLRRDLHRNDLDSAETLLAQLLQHGPDYVDPGIVLLIHLLHIEALSRRGDLAAALAKVDDLLSAAGTRAAAHATTTDDDGDAGQDSKQQQPNPSSTSTTTTTSTSSTTTPTGATADTHALVRLLLVKAHLLARTGRPERGFTIAMRAAALAWRSRLLALLWQACGALGAVLNALGEFAACERLLESALPRCLEAEVAQDAGGLWACLADARVGVLGELKKKKQEVEDPGRYGAVLARAHYALDRALECFSAVEDTGKRCEMLAKKGMLYRAEGEKEKAEECARRYVAVWQEEVASTGKGGGWYYG